MCRGNNDYSTGSDQINHRLDRLFTELEAIKASINNLNLALQETKQVAKITSKRNSESINSSEEESNNLKCFEFEVITVDEKGEEIKRESKQAQYLVEDLGNGVTLDMVYIPGGSFMMGTAVDEIKRLYKRYHTEKFIHEHPQYQITMQPFLMGKYPVTQGEWKAISSLPKVKSDLNPDPSKFKGDDLPVENISWEDAIEFCQRLSFHTGREYRLPSEAEWEYACRAGTTTPFNFGETITGKLVNYNARMTYGSERQGAYRQRTTPVGIFPPNAFGLYDMHGNVWNWCEDDWHDNYEDTPMDGRAWTSRNSSLKVMRGGSWFINPWFCRSASRFLNLPDVRNGFFGFRVACGVT